MKVINGDPSPDPRPLVSPEPPDLSSQVSPDPSPQVSEVSDPTMTSTALWCQYVDRVARQTCPELTVKAGPLHEELRVRAAELEAQEGPGQPTPPKGKKRKKRRSNPVVGVNFLVQVSHRRRKQYYCQLCSVRMKHPIADHMTSLSHRHNYVRLKYPGWTSSPAEMEKKLFKMSVHLEKVDRDAGMSMKPGDLRQTAPLTNHNPEDLRQTAPSSNPDAAQGPAQGVCGAESGETERVCPFPVSLSEEENGQTPQRLLVHIPGEPQKYLYLSMGVWFFI
ncbi:unnamed protein product [Coregonus sp. 'balchen']|nr:unnamed protein product [Coregonus sp. 'balchen']